MTNNLEYPIQIGKRMWFDLINKLIYLFVFCLILTFIIRFALGAGKGLVPFVVPLFVFMGLFVLLLMGTYVEYLNLKAYKYECKKDTIYFSGGIISRFEKNLPYTRIQHVILYETFWQRFLGLTSISIETARDFGGGVLIPDILKEDAEKLKEFILSKSSKSKSVAGI